MMKSAPWTSGGILTVERTNKRICERDERALAGHARNDDAVMRAKREGDDVREVDIATCKRPCLLLCVRKDVWIVRPRQPNITCVDDVHADSRQGRAD